ncbi:MAG: hypothetical protein H6492_00605 [Candidatus Paracaedibacteraceae bacterium]|nr:hypothetical protein [Candidatus Paracaedibacteraceae bacterium]
MRIKHLLSVTLLIGSLTTTTHGAVLTEAYSLVSRAASHYAVRACWVDTTVRNIATNSRVAPPIYQTRVHNPAKNITIHVKRTPFFNMKTHAGMKWIPISHDADFRLYMQHRSPLFIPKAYAALDHFTGATDLDFDSFKGAFSFKFLLNVNKADSLSEYLYWIIQYRTFLRINVYQSVPIIDERRPEVYTGPTESLFSKEDIEEFTLCFFTDLLTKTEEEQYVPNPFVLGAEANLFLCGYLNEGYFSNTYNEHRKYLAALKDMKTLIETSNISLNK